MTEDQIKHMVDRFLNWKLPEDFHPDCGIHFDAEAAIKMDPRNGRYEPVGTNLFTAIQAKAMVRYMLEGMPKPKRTDGYGDPAKGEYNAFLADDGSGTVWD